MPSAKAWRVPTRPRRVAHQCTRPPATATASTLTTPGTVPVPPSHHQRYTATTPAASRPAVHPSKSAISATGTLRASK